MINSVVAGFVFAIMDSAWFAIFMKKFAENQLQPILRMSGGKLSAHMPSVFCAYFLMILISSMFLAPKVAQLDHLSSVFLYGATMGLCVFGIFDFTNSALFTPYPMKFVVADVAWGTFMYGVLAIILNKMAPFLSN